ncbi:MAG: hypothetical protein IV084_05525 [Rugosibacter sp.]|nr:hypothetical protein [Rugosibacter sp.]
MYAEERLKAGHLFLARKWLWGFAKVRYRVFVQKRIQIMLMMINLVKWMRPLVGDVRPV